MSNYEELEELMVFVSGTANSYNTKMGIGCIIYNQGEFINCISKKVDGGYINKAKYMAIIEGIELALKYKPKHIELFLDTKIIINQVEKLWKINNNELLELKNEIDRLKDGVDISVKWVARTSNQAADHLAAAAINYNQGIFTDGFLQNWEMPVKTDSIYGKYLPPVNKECIRQIRMINTYHYSFSYNDLFKLKTGGRDNYSDFTESELIDTIKLRFGEKTIEWVNEVLHSAEVSFKLEALRWTARGLYPNLALKKALISAEIASSFRAKQKK